MAPSKTITNTPSASIDTPDGTTAEDVAADAAKKPMFSKEDLNGYIKIGIEAALVKVEEDFELKLAALTARLNSVEADNQDLREQLASVQMDSQLAEERAEKQRKKTDRLAEEQSASLNALRDSIRRHESLINDLEQYSRRSHLRIRGLKVLEGESYKGAIVRLCKNRLNVHLEETDLDDAHPLPTPAPKKPTATNGLPPPSLPPPVMIARFHRRELRDAILRARSQLKGQNIAISEDLTAPNQKLLKKLYDSDCIVSSWSWMGKIYGISRGETRAKRYTIHDNIPTSG
jgi:signal transduction histidine kinase